MTERRQVFRRPWSALVLIGIVSVVLFGVAAGLAFDEGLKPDWLNYIMIAIFAGMGVLVIILLPKPRQPIVIVGSEGIQVLVFQDRPLPWEEIRNIIAQRNDLPDGKPGSWTLWLSIDRPDRFFTQAVIRDGAVRLPLNGVRRPAANLPKGDEVLASIERFMPVERRTTAEETALRIAERQAQAKQPGPPVPVAFYTGGGELFIAVWLILMFSGLAIAMIFNLGDAGSFGPPWLAPTIGVGIFVVLGVMVVHTGLWPRRPMLTVAQDGIFIRERMRSPIPWIRVQTVEVVFDNTVINSRGGIVGWILRVQVEDPESWAPQSQRGRFDGDNTLSISLGGFSGTRKDVGISVEMSEAIEPFHPVIVRQIHS